MRVLADQVAGVARVDNQHVARLETHVRRASMHVVCRLTEDWSNSATYTGLKWYELPSGERWMLCWSWTAELSAFTYVPRNPVKHRFGRQKMSGRDRLGQ